MEQDVKTKLEEHDAKLNAIYASVEKIRKYLMIIVWTGVILVVLPVLGLIFAIPKFINTYTTTFEGLL